MARETRGATAILPVAIRSAARACVNGLMKAKCSWIFAKEEAEGLDWDRFAPWQHSEDYDPAAGPGQGGRPRHGLGHAGAFERQVRAPRPNPQGLRGRRRGGRRAER